MRAPPVLRGLMLLATFRAGGLALVGGRVADLLASLAPLLGLPLAVTLLLVLAAAPQALGLPLAAVAIFLAPMVVSEALARWWRREAEWGRFATAYNLCQWPLTALSALILAAGNLLAAAGVPPLAAAIATAAAMLGYQLSLHFFLARHALRLAGWRAALLTLATDGSAAALLVLFFLLNPPLFHGPNGSAG